MNKYVSEHGILEVAVCHSLRDMDGACVINNQPIGVFLSRFPNLLLGMVPIFQIDRVVPLPKHRVCHLYDVFGDVGCKVIMEPLVYSGSGGC